MEYTLKDKIDALNLTIKQTYDTMRELLISSVRELMVKNPFIASVGWRQYTPEHNDGFPCEFSSNAVSGNIQINSVLDNDDTSDCEKEYDSAQVQIEEILKLFTEESYEEMFGDNVHVCITEHAVEIQGEDGRY